MGMLWALPAVGDDREGAYHIGRPATLQEIAAWNN